MNLHFAYCQGDILLAKGEDGRLTIPSGEEPPVAFQPWEKVTRLTAPLSPPMRGEMSPAAQSLPLMGELEGASIYRLDRPVTGRDDLQMMGLRQTFDILSPEMYRLAGKCAELVYWDQNSKFCGCCGAPMKWHTEISKHCTECGKELWPQLATAIIVRVTRFKDLKIDDLRIDGQAQPKSSNQKSSNTKIEEVLLVHAHSFRTGYFGLVAGFVETGETLEDCVRREVWEETHLRIKNIRYFASQPWPYPAGLMVGFTAEYESGELKLQREELSNGGWFRKDNLPEIPNRSSLARWLIDDWRCPSESPKGGEPMKG